MKSRLHRIEITNFKAFREFKLDLEGRHLDAQAPWQDQTLEPIRVIEGKA